MNDDDADIKADNPADFRRLKRAKLWERNDWCIWRNTPSPTPEERDAMRKAAAPEPRHNGHHHHHQHKHHAHDRTGGSRPQDGKASQQQQNGDTQEADGAAGATAVDEEDEQDPVAAQQAAAMAAIDEEEAELYHSWQETQRALIAAVEAARRDQEEQEREVGPELPEAMRASKAANYGGALRPGEGERMAAFVQSGKRIPRRGEVGLTAEQIESFENLGYIMSGNRHSRMNAVRIRKENQIYSAEEKAALAMFNFEENRLKEQKIVENLQKLVQRTLDTHGGGGGGGAGEAPGA